MNDQQTTPSPHRKALKLVTYLAAIGLLLFLVGTILYSLYAIFTTTNY